MAPISLALLGFEYPTNGKWTIYGRSGPSIYAQPHFITYPLFVPICIQGDILIHIGIKEIPDGFIKDSSHNKSKFYKRLLKLLTNISQDPEYPFETEYKSVPFNDSHIGIKWSSRGYFGGVESDIYWGSKFENETRSAVFLRNVWGFGKKDYEKELETGTGMPVVVSLKALWVRAWLHDTVALVSVDGCEGRLYAFKTNRSPQGLYQEIYTLLNIPLHPNILERPCYLVMKQTVNSILNPLDSASQYCLEPTQPIVGFLTPYHSGGSLKNYIKCRTISLKQQARWALQLTSALLHIFEYGGSNGKCGRYSALKMDNIVLDSFGNLRLIDFESAGTWVQYTPIEVISKVQRVGKVSRFTNSPGAKYLFSIIPKGCSICSPHPCSVSQGTTKSECYAVHEKIIEYKFSQTNILLKPNSDEYYRGPEKHKKIPFWTDATDAECEAAMVWMLGCCLWCMFEERSCLSDMGNEWFPVGSSLWKRVNGGISVDVLDIVRKALQTYADRPKLSEIYEVLKHWEKAVMKRNEFEEGAKKSVDEESGERIIKW